MCGRLPRCGMDESSSAKLEKFTGKRHVMDERARAGDLPEKQCGGKTDCHNGKQSQDDSHYYPILDVRFRYCCDSGEDFITLNLECTFSPDSVNVSPSNPRRSRLELATALVAGRLLPGSKGEDSGPAEAPTLPQADPGIELDQLELKNKITRIRLRRMKVKEMNRVDTRVIRINLPDRAVSLEKHPISLNVYKVRVVKPPQPHQFPIVSETMYVFAPRRSG